MKTTTFHTVDMLRRVAVGPGGMQQPILGPGGTQQAPQQGNDDIIGLPAWLFWTLLGVLVVAVVAVVAVVVTAVVVTAVATSRRRHSRRKKGL